MVSTHQIFTLASPYLGDGALTVPSSEASLLYSPLVCDVLYPQVPTFAVSLCGILVSGVLHAHHALLRPQMKSKVVGRDWDFSEVLSRHHPWRIMMASLVT